MGGRSVERETYVFGSFQLYPAERLVLDNGRPAELDSRALDILVALVEAAGGTESSRDSLARPAYDDRRRGLATGAHQCATQGAARRQVRQPLHRQCCGPRISIRRTPYVPVQPFGSCHTRLSTAPQPAGAVPQYD